MEEGKDGEVRDEGGVEHLAICIPPAGQNVEPVPPNSSVSVPFSETIKEEKRKKETKINEKREKGIELCSHLPDSPPVPTLILPPTAFFIHV